MRIFLLVFLLLTSTTFASSAQGFFSTYIVSYIKGPGTYTLVDGTVGNDNLRFHTRKTSVLFAGKDKEFSAEQVKSFSINGHTLVPAGNFEFVSNKDSFHAQNAFIEFIDTTGALELAVFHTCVPAGTYTFSFATYLVRPHGAAEFISGPSNDKSMHGKKYWQRVAGAFTRWPELQKQLVANKITFENFPALVAQANQTGQ